MIARVRVPLSILVLLAWPAVRVYAQSVTVSTVGDVIRIHAPGYGFLKGEPLVRLKDGRSVRVELGLTVLPGPGVSPLAESRLVFALSYDLWEERFAAAQAGSPSHAISHLTAAGIETWCVEQLGVPVSALGAAGRDVSFWIHLEYRILDGDGAPGSDDGAGFTLQGLIETLSRRRKAEALPHAIDAGPFRLRQ